jgi:hypothetical protein
MNAQHAALHLSHLNGYASMRWIAERTRARNYCSATLRENHTQTNRVCPTVMVMKLS